ncbi:YihY/virulence factor BrkB family protein [Agromyces sp. NPDC058484]|uniref:YihY/virulence factor BrkB family protein n=1 Tax=Agromyces sp. NPDC058484 TaxID=3346524 RepID=UPI0036490A82
MPDHDSPAQLSHDDWRVILTRTVHEFRINQVYDIAAALTYYAVLATFPTLLAVLALLGIFGSAEAVANDVLRVIEDLGGSSVVDPLRGAVEQLLDASHAATAFIVGIVVALWATSGFVGSFGRGMNRIYKVEEGRPFWRMRPAMIGISAVLLVLATVSAFAILLTGPIAESTARVLGLDEGVVFWWDLGKLPVLAAITIFVIALLYWAGPNVKRGNLRWFSVGAVAALLAWMITTVLFGGYALGFGSYERMYGALGGAVAFLLWLWLSNLAMLFGAVLDTEVERARQLRAGVAAENQVQLPLRDDRTIETNREQRASDYRASSAMKPDTAVDGLVTSAGVRPPE